MNISYRNNQIHRGEGIGSIFKNMFRFVSPFLKKLISTGVKTGKEIIHSDAAKEIMDEAKSSAIRAGITLANQALQGENVIQASRENIKNMGNDLKNKTLDILERKRKQSDVSSHQLEKKKKKKKKKKKTGGNFNDIFDFNVKSRKKNKILK